MYMPQLTETVRTVRKDHPGAFRYKWEFSDGPARFEAVFIDRTNQSTRWTEHAPSGETENRLPRNIIEVQRYSHLD